MPPAARAPRRRGFTLVELLVAIALLAIIAGGVLTTLRRQQRYYNHAGELIEQRSQLRQSASILPADFRGISTVGRDLIAMEPKRARILATFGGAVICRRNPAAPTESFEIPPLDAANNTYTSWAYRPEVGDTVMVFDEGSMAGAEDDKWLRFEIAEITEDAATYCPTPNILINNAGLDNNKPRYRIRVLRPGITYVPGNALPVGVPEIPPTVVTPGAVVRFTRPVDYALYQSAQDGQWYLGLSEYRAKVWSARQAVSGPYRAAGTTGNEGLTFRYFNDYDVEITSAAPKPQSVARIDIVTRSASTAKNQFTKRSDGLFSDSLSVRVAVRNRQ